MKKTALIGFMIIMLVACGSKDNAPKTAKKSKNNVYHVFDEENFGAKNDNNENVSQETESVQETQAPIETKVSATSPQPFKPLAEGPMSVVQNYTKELQDLDEKTKNDSSRDQKVAQAVRRFFDFNTLAKESLGSHWFQINAKDQKEFSDLFIELIEQSYLSRSRTLVGNYDIEFKDEKITKQKAVVSCVVKKDDVDIDITYHLHKRAGKWVIYNIVFDNVDLIRNYNTQFTRIIAKSKFTGLVDTMRKKLASDDAQVEL